MRILHIDTKNYNKRDETGETPINTLNKFITDGHYIFALIYMEGCGPCNATRPEWNKLKNVLKYQNLKNNNVLIVDIDKDVLDKVKNIGSEPKGFPTLRFITKNGKISEDFEDCKLSEEYKNRTIDSFVKWIKFKLNKTEVDKTEVDKYHKSKHIKGKQTGGKWSKKYKKSINCKRPKGFSQKQYCKYTRKRR
jgi:hypothetical protein